MHYEELKGKNALITGAAGGIGRATAIVFAKQGANLILCDINEKMLDEAAAEAEQHGVQVVTVVTDVRKAADVERAVKTGVEKFKQIDILLNCAGISLEYKILDMPEEEFDRTMDINFKSVFQFCKAVGQHMIDNRVKGKIVTVSSQAAKMGEYNFGVYGASKAAINTFTQALALELAEYGINVNAICPGFIDTEMLAREFREQGPREGLTAEEYKQKLSETIPLKRMAAPREVGEFLAFLASDSSSYITGVSLTIAGGAMLI